MANPCFRPQSSAVKCVTSCHSCLVHSLGVLNLTPTVRIASRSSWANVGSRNPYTIIVGWGADVKNAPASGIRLTVYNLFSFARARLTLAGSSVRPTHFTYVPSRRMRRVYEGPPGCDQFSRHTAGLSRWKRDGVRYFFRRSPSGQPSRAD